MLRRNIRSLVAFVIFCGAPAMCVPKFEDGGFIPSSISYLEKSAKAQDQIAMSSQGNLRTEAPVSKRNDAESNDVTDRNQEPRFGFTNLASTGTGYGVSPYAPAKIDLGGLLLGAIIGVGSILIIPKILYVLSGSYGAYARSDDNSFVQTVTKLDDALARHGIDTTSCMQRAVCNYSQQAITAMREAGETQSEEKLSSFDKMVGTIANNQIFRTAVEGTAIQEALDAGRSGRNCTRSYPHCGFSTEAVLSLVSNVLALVTSANTRTLSSTTGVAAL